MSKKNGLENYYIIKDGKKLSFGYTTGSCAAAAAKAAAFMLFDEQKVTEVGLMTPKGILLQLQIVNTVRKESYVKCAVQKDGGDDPDITHGLLIYAKVWKTNIKGIHISGGEGIGKVTKQGLDQPVGNYAINSVPRRMIHGELVTVCKKYAYDGGLCVEISIPGGDIAAEKTFNPRLGIEGGLSVLGTTGIVVPMSQSAILKSIRLEMRILLQKKKCLLIVPGNYGQKFVEEKLGLSGNIVLKCSNFVGDIIDIAIEEGAERILFVAHIGKFIKTAGGIMNTHSKEADCRLEILSANALKAGVSAETAVSILACKTTEEAIIILKHEGFLEPVMNQIIDRCDYYLNKRAVKALRVEVLLFSNKCGRLAATEGVDEIVQRILG